MTQSSTRAILRGVKTFGQFLQSERSRFAAAPILLITSTAADVAAAADAAADCRNSSSKQQIDDAVRHTNFMLQQQLGFRTAVFHASCAAFPTVSDVRAATALAARVGASTVAAVGSGSAIDLAKAVVVAASSTTSSVSSASSFSAAAKSSTLDELVLVPATYGACLAAASSHSLVLDPIEEALLVQPSSALSQQQQQRDHAVIPTTTTTTTTIVALEQKLFYTASREEALFAAISIALDHVLHRRGTTTTTSNNEAAKIDSLLERAIACLEGKQKGADEHDTVSDIMFTAGELISYGLDDSRRSTPLALAASLIPNSGFEQYSATTMMASLVPAYCQAITEAAERHQLGKYVPLIKRIPVLSAPTIVTNDSFRTLLSYVHSNQVLWNCLDATDGDFRTILSNHLLVV